MKRLSGIRGLMLRRARLSELPTRQGPCEVDRVDGTIRYFVAAKLPKPVYLCDKDYLKIRDRLEAALAEILGGSTLTW